MCDGGNVRKHLNKMEGRGAGVEGRGGGMEGREGGKKRLRSLFNVTNLTTRSLNGWCVCV